MLLERAGDDAVAGAVRIGTQARPERRVGLVQVVRLLEQLVKLLGKLGKLCIVKLNQLRERVNLVANGRLQPLVRAVTPVVQHRSVGDQSFLR